ncbi:hypothetical protein, partial [Saccharopolyspora thermophila]|uniref:hypothetical protein n=1 Tax=Saccharopolyspora thermophila TaxID=89367 RepID=UPI001E4B35D4
MYSTDFARPKNGAASTSPSSEDAQDVEITDVFLEPSGTDEHRQEAAHRPTEAVFGGIRASDASRTWGTGANAGTANWWTQEARGGQPSGRQSTHEGQEVKPRKRMRTPDEWQEIGPNKQARTTSGYPIGHATVNLAIRDLLGAPRNQRASRAFRENYLDALEKSINERRPVGFVVNAILPYRDVDRIPSVVKKITEGVRDMEGRIAFVFGVNGPRDSESAVRRAIETFAPQIQDGSEPIALVPVVPAGFTESENAPIGTLRNHTLDSAVNKSIVAAMVDLGMHPYISIQDFDEGSRRVGSSTGEHIFNHWENRLDTASGLKELELPDDDVRPIRPLMMSGGYRLGDGNLFEKALESRIQEKARIEARLSTPRQEGPIGKPESGLRRVLKKAEEDIAFLESIRHDFGVMQERFTKAIIADMAARDRYAQNHPLHPYSPEPNLCIDGTVLLKDGLTVGSEDEKFGFGKGKAEFGALARSLNLENTKEFAQYYEPLSRQAPEESPDTDQFVADLGKNSDSDNVQLERTKAEIAEAVKAEAPQRHPVRGVPFLADFSGSTIETDLTRIALTWARSGQKNIGLPQTHADPNNLRNRTWYAGKGTGEVQHSRKKAGRLASGGTGLSRFRKDWQENADDSQDPLTGRRGGEDPGSLSDKAAKLLGVPKQNVLNVSISIALNISEFREHGVRIGVAGDPVTKGVIGFNSALAAQAPTMQRHLEQFRKTFLDRGLAKQDGLENSFYQKVIDTDPGLAESAVQLRAATVEKGVEIFRGEGSKESSQGANYSDMPATAFTLEHRTDQDLGSLSRALHDGPFATGRTSSPSDELVGRLIATQVGATLLVRHPNGDLQRLDPFPVDGTAVASREVTVQLSGAEPLGSRGSEPRGFGGNSGVVLGSSSVGSDVISAETFADDEGAERAFLGEFFPNLSGVNRPV